MVSGANWPGMNAAPSAYTPPEELANAITHGFGVALSIVGLVLLLVTASRHGDAWGVSSSAVFGATLILLYSVSTLYHSLPGARRKFLLRKCDHAAIFLLIAGTYTPVLLVSLRGAWGWSLFGVIWGLAAAGVAMKFWFTGRFGALSMAIYIAMGWLVVVALRPMLHAVPWAGCACCWPAGSAIPVVRCFTRGKHCRITTPCGISGFWRAARATGPPCIATSCRPAPEPHIQLGLNLTAVNHLRFTSSAILRISLAREVFLLIHWAGFGSILYVRTRCPGKQSVAAEPGVGARLCPR